MCDCVQLLNIVDTFGPSFLKAAAAFEKLKLSPKKLSSLTTNRIKEIKIFLRTRCADKIGKQNKLELELQKQKDSNKDIKKSKDTPTEEGGRKAGEQIDTKTLPPSILRNGPK